MNWFCLKACNKCGGGGLAVDDGDWICLQCGTYYYTGLYRNLYQRGGVSTPSQPTRGSGDTGHRDDLRRAKIFGPFKGSGQEVGHLLGAV